MKSFFYNLIKRYENFERGYENFAEKVFRFV